MTISEAADRLGVARPSLSQLVNEHRSVSPEMALPHVVASGRPLS